MAEMSIGGGVSIHVLIEFLGDRALARSTPPDLTLTHAAALTPGDCGAVSFATGASESRLRAVSSSASSLVLVNEDAISLLDNTQQPALIAVVNPRREFARVVTAFFGSERPRGVSSTATVSATAIVGPNCYIGPGAYIAPGVVIGADCSIGANCVLLEGTTIGDQTSIGPNTTIGYVGFGYAREDDGTPILVPHSGGVDIGSRVDIGANTCIDRGTLDDTVIEDDVKVDNLVHIAHNCRIEKAAFVIATAILCGGVRVGPRAWIAPNVSVREQLSIGADATVGLASTVTRNVPDGATVVGAPAREIQR